MGEMFAAISVLSWGFAWGFAVGVIATFRFIRWCER